MRLVRFQAQGRSAYGILNNDEVGELDGEGYDSLTSLRAMHRTDAVNFLSPCVPTKIVAVGLNYRDHARELGMAAPDEPILFLKPPTSLIGSGDAIIMPSMSRMIGVSNRG